MNEFIIPTISDLQLHVHHHGIPKVHIRGFFQIYDITLKLLLGNPPSSFKDHRKSGNPYLSRYGESRIEKMKSYTATSKLCFITDRIRFMTNEAEKLIKGSVHEDDFLIVHYALVLVTAKETINYMRNNGYLHRRLLPFNGIQDGTPYTGRPVGNSPEFMPLDILLNRDILHSLRMNSVLSRYIVDGEKTNDKEKNMCFSYLTLR